MIGTTAPIGPDRDPDERLNGKFSLAQITGFRNLLHQLIEPRIDIIGKLYFYNGFHPHSAHACCRSANIGFLDRRIEDPVIPELFCQRRGLAEDAPHPAPYVLSVSQGLRVLFHYLPDTIQRGIDYLYSFTPFRT